MRKFAIALIVMLLIIWGLWVAVPISVIESTIVEAVQHENATIKIEGLRKGLFCRLSADRVGFGRAQMELIAGRDVHAYIDPISVITLRPRVSLSGSIDGGSFSGVLSFSKGAMSIDLAVNKARLIDLPAFMQAGMRGRGLLYGNAVLTKEGGEVKFFVTDAHLEPITYSGVVVPLNLFDTIQGVGDIQQNGISLTSVSLEGRDISARMKGVIQDEYMDLQLEVMPGRTYLDNPLFRASIERYQVSPGYYLIPFKGPISP